MKRDDTFSGRPTLRVTILAGQSYRGVRYLEDSLLNLTPNAAVKAVRDGIARPAPVTEQERKEWDRALEEYGR